MGQAVVSWMGEQVGVIEWMDGAGGHRWVDV